MPTRPTHPRLKVVSNNDHHSQNGHHARFATVAQLKGTANDNHKAIMGAARTTVEHARQAGEALLKLKELVGHGDWQAWLKKNFQGSPETARLYARIADNWKIVVKCIDEETSISQLKAMLAKARGSHTSKSNRAGHQPSQPQLKRLPVCRRTAERFGRHNAEPAAGTDDKVVQLYFEPTQGRGVLAMDGASTASLGTDNTTDTVFAR